MRCLLIISLLTSSALAQKPYRLPAEDAHALEGIDVARAQIIGEEFTRAYRECDEHGGLRGCKGDPSRNTVILRFPNGAVFFDAKMAIDADGSYYSTQAGYPNQPQTSLRYPTGKPDDDNDGPSLDAENVPYIVIPKDDFAKATGVTIGDVAAVVWQGRTAFAVVGDEGPVRKIGEGSMRLHDLLGHMACKEKDDRGRCVRTINESIDAPVLYVVFPHTHEHIVPGMTPKNIDERIQKIGREQLAALRHNQRTRANKGGN